MKMKLQLFAQLTVVINTLPEETSAGVDRIVRITGGNAEGQLCHFPFKVREKKEISFLTIYLVRKENIPQMYDRRSGR